MPYSNIFEEGHLYSLHLENKFISDAGPLWDFWVLEAF